MQNDFGEFEFEASSTARNMTNSVEIPREIPGTDDGGGEGIDLEVGPNEEVLSEVELENPFGKKRRKLKSAVWNDFVRVRVRGVKYAKCNHCRKYLKRNDQGTTTQFKRHQDVCTDKVRGGQGQTTINFPPEGSEVEAPVLNNGKYDHAKQREAIAHWILAQQKAFNVVEDATFTNMFKVNLPLYERVTRHHARTDCIEVYNLEKNKLMGALGKINHISLTTDLWKSESQKRSYMCVTGHYVDSEWKLQKRVLSFVPLPPPHKGSDIAEGLRKCIHSWGIERKVYSISVDNATNNDSAMQILLEIFGTSRELPLRGKLFHVRCCAHILNLVVKDGLEEIRPVIACVKDTIHYINASEGRLLRFRNIVREMNLPVNKLIMACDHRWNSTYEMLKSAVRIKAAFPIFAQSDLEYKSCPTAEDWPKVEKIMTILEVFYEATHVMSASEYPTSNKFLLSIYRVKEVLDKVGESSDPLLQRMFKEMKEKFDKYWGQCNLVMSIGSVLDPRYNMLSVQFAFSQIYHAEEADRNLSLVKEATQNLFRFYKDRESSLSRSGSANTGSNSTASTFSTAVTRNEVIPSGWSRFSEFVSSTNRDRTWKSELEIYLEEKVYEVTSESDAAFDALEWCKANATKFPVLSKMARDVLAIPITTVASEATFSVGGRVLNSYRSSLTSEAVEALICGGDWVKRLHGLKKQNEEDKPIELDFSEGSAAV